jgi:hypothetical protein
MQSQFERWCSSPARDTVVLATLFAPLSAFAPQALAQDPLPIVEIVEASIDAADSPVQLAADIYEMDEVAELMINQDVKGGAVRVYLDEELLGQFPAAEGDLFDVALPSRATLGSLLQVVGLDGTVLLQSPVMERTFFRGNVLVSGAYGSSEPDVADLLYIYEFLYNGGPAPAVLAHADVDGNGTVELLDLLVLWDHLSGGLSYYLPLADVRYDGSLTDSMVFLANFEDLGNWGKAIHCPPKEKEGAKPKDLDGNPKTKEWTFPCTHAALGAANPLYSTMSTAWGPRDPDLVPDGGNSAFIWMLYCVSVESGEPETTRKPLGKCMWPNGQNKKSIGAGTVTYTSTNPNQNDGPVGAAYKFVTDLATCKLTITKDADGNGTFETDVYSGDPSGWNRWPAGV